MNPISVNNYYYQVKVSEDTFFSNVLGARCVVVGLLITG